MLNLLKMRSPWKVKFQDPRLNRASFGSSIDIGSTTSAKTTNKRIKIKTANFHTHLRAAIIPSSTINQRVAVHMGNSFKSFVVQKFMIGRHFGEFSLTKKLGKYIHTHKKKKKKGKK